MAAGALITLVLVGSVVGFVLLWLLIEGETSNPPVLDREEAERRAIERGGRGVDRESTGERSGDDHDDESVGWN
ncbi:hypothetical protein [Halovivax cerinus]|uniref:Uncharacterized protein n=1 Tax=Halovivax cerinus TaxID=1487865 RepID=A0ABD5NLI0_9EURY|nr:hypothetical protein [Halovivax cerinus]